METDQPQINQRRYPRVKLEAKVAVLNGKALQFERASEISEGGIKLQVRETLPVDSEIELCMFLPNGRFITSFARVVYSIEPTKGNYFLGLCFCHPKPEVQDEIRLFVSDLLDL